MRGGNRIGTLRAAYSLFNGRDIAGLLALMTDDVEWPNVADAAVLRGHAAVRRYWEGQFAVANPEVTPVEFHEVGSDDIVVSVDQQVLDLSGAPIVPPKTVFHRYTFAGDLVRRMRVYGDRSTALNDT